MNTKSHRGHVSRVCIDKNHSLVFGLRRPERWFRFEPVGDRMTAGMTLASAQLLLLEALREGHEIEARGECGSGRRPPGRAHEISTPMAPRSICYFHELGREEGKMIHFDWHVPEHQWREPPTSATIGNLKTPLTVSNVEPGVHTLSLEIPSKLPDGPHAIQLLRESNEACEIIEDVFIKGKQAKWKRLEPNAKSGEEQTTGLVTIQDPKVKKPWKHFRELRFVDRRERIFKSQDERLEIVGRDLKIWSDVPPPGTKLRLIFDSAMDPRDGCPARPTDIAQASTSHADERLDPDLRYWEYQAEYQTEAEARAEAR
ncbi:MAG: hypothetical protein AAF533_13295 [Acidobacteriota bacterium]